MFNTMTYLRSIIRGTSKFVTATTLLTGVVLMTGCDSNSPVTRPNSSTKITAANKPASPAPANDATNGTSSSSTLYLNKGRSTTMDDEKLTQPMVLISGKITYEDGPAVTTGTVTLSSYVLDQANSFKSHEAGVAQIGPDGTYSLLAPDARIHTIKSKGEFPTTVDSVTGIELSNLPNLRKVTKDIKVLRGVKITGRVIDETGKPVADASVITRKRAENPNYNPGSSYHDETSSTASGEFDFPYVAPGSTFLGASHPDLASGTAEVEVPTTGPVTITMLRGGATVTGHVYRQDTGEPFAGATITVHEKEGFQPYPKKAESAADGSFRVEHVSPGKTSIAMDTNDPKLGHYPVPDSPVAKQTTMADGDTTDVTILVYPGHTLTGKVFDKETMEPLAGAEIVSQDGLSTVTSNASGSYTLPHVFPGASQTNISIRADLEGYIPAIEERNQRPGYVKKSLSIYDAAPVLDIPMVKTVTVSGTVKTADGVPVPGASVQVKEGGGYYSQDIKTEKTQADGTYKLEIRPFHNGVIKAESRGYAAGYSESFHVDNKDVENLDITLNVGATVAGTVVDPDGKPVEKTNVGAHTSMMIGMYGIGDTHGNSETDIHGRFLLSNLPKNITLYAHHNDYSSAEGIKLSLIPGESKSDVIMQLRSSHSISGRVLDSKDKPVEGVHVYASGDTHGSTNSDKDGHFTLTKLIDGVYTVQTSGIGRSAAKEGVKTGTTDLVLRIPETETEDSARATLIGTVVDAITDEPIEDFQIGNLGTRITKSPDHPGRFVAEGVTPGVAYVVDVKAPGYVSTKIRPTVPKGKPVVEETFKIGKGGAITGTVVDAETQKPVPNMTVLNWGIAASEYDRLNTMPTGTTSTDDEGNFTLAPAPIGDNFVVIRPEAPLAEVTRNIKVENEQIADAGKIEISRGGVIYGSVTLGPDRKPLPDATVSIYGSGNQNGTDTIRKSVSTDAEGKFRFEGLPARSYSMSVASYNVSKSVELALGEEEKADINVGGVTVTGTVTRGGQPVRSSISATPEDTNATRVSASPHSGKYELTGLTPGKWKFQVYQQGTSTGRTHEETVTIPDTETFEHNIALPDVSISGIVVDTDGKPVAEAQAMLSQKQTSAGAGDGWRGGYNATAMTDADGRFSFTGLTEGTYQVVARKDEMGSAMEPAVEARDGKPAELKLELNPNGGTLVSVALNMATGQGLSQAWCYLYSENGRFTHAAQRNAEGIMIIKNIPPGTYRTNVSFWEYSQSEQEVEIKAGETATIEDVLYPAGAIEWTLQNADGSPAKAVATATPLDPDSFEEPKTGSTDGTGKLVIRGLAPGNYSVTAKAEGKPAVTDTFTVVAADIHRKTLAVPGW